MGIDEPARANTFKPCLPHFCSIVKNSILTGEMLAEREAELDAPQRETRTHPMGAPRTAWGYAFQLAGERNT
jgi:hypothetical protein